MDMRTALGATIMAATLVGLPAAPATRGSEAAPERRAMVVYDAAPSAEALIDSFLQALRDRNRDALRRLRVTESEYRGIIMPGHVAVGQQLKEYREDISKYAWDTLNTKSAHWEMALLSEFGGRAYEVKEISYAEGVQRYATYTGYRQLRLMLRSGEGSDVELATGSIAEIDGQFKFVSYVRD